MKETFQKGDFFFRRGKSNGAAAAAVDSGGIPAAASAAEVRDGSPNAVEELPDDVAKSGDVKADTGRTNSPDAEVAAADAAAAADVVHGDGGDGGDAIPPDLERYCKCARDRDRSTCSCVPIANSTGRNKWTTFHRQPDRDRFGKHRRPCAEWRCSASGYPDFGRCLLPSKAPISVSP